jgi:hypothetical protein
MGTRTAEALAKARQFLSEKITARDKAIILISDLEGDFDALIETADEIDSALKTGIKVYVIVMREGKQMKAVWGPRESQVREMKMVRMDDQDGIDHICKEIGEMERSLIREEEISLKEPLISFLIPPILGLLVLCLLLSETRLRKIP